MFLMGVVNHALNAIPKYQFPKYESVVGEQSKSQVYCSIMTNQMKILSSNPGRDKNMYLSLECFIRSFTSLY